MAKRTIYELAVKIAGELSRSFTKSTRTAQQQLEAIAKANERAARNKALLASLKAGASQFKEVGSAASKVADQFSAMGRAARIGGLAVSAALVKATVDAAQFELRMAKIGTMLDAEGKKRLPEIAEDIDRLAKGYGLSAETLQEAAFQALSASVPFERLSEFMEVASKSAVGGFTDVNVAVDGLSNVINAFGLDASQAVAVADSFFVANRLGKVTFEELASQLGEVNSVANGLGLTFRDVTSFLASVTKRGVLTDQAVTSLGTALSAMADPTAEAAEEAQRLGLAFGPQAVKEAGGFLRWLEHLQERTGGAVEVLAKLFGGKRGLRGMMPALTASGLEDIARGLREMERSGAALDAFEIVAATSAHEFARMKEEVLSLGRAIGKLALPAVNRLLGRIVGTVTDVNGKLSEAKKAEIQRTIDKVAAALEGAWNWLVKTAVAIAWAIEKVGGMEAALDLLAKGLVAVYAIKIAAWASQAAYAMWGLNAAMLANPVVALATLFAAWGVGIILLAVYWEDLHAALKRSHPAIKLIAAAVVFLTSAFWIVPVAIVLIIKQLMKLGGAYDWVTTKIGGAIDAVKEFLGLSGAEVPTIEGGPAPPQLASASRGLSGALAQASAPSGPGPLSLEYRPQINLSGAEANAAGVSLALKAGADDLLERLQEAQEQQRRLAFG